MWEIGNRLRERREAEKLDIGQVAEYEGVSKSYISQLETGTNKPNWNLLARLARRYRTSADYILGLTDDPRPASNESLPEGAAEIIECMAEMSPRGRAELLSVCESIRRIDENWRKLELTARFARVMLTEEELAELNAELSDLVPRIGWDAALDVVEARIVADFTRDHQRKDLD